MVLRADLGRKVNPSPVYPVSVYGKPMRGEHIAPGSRQCMRAVRCTFVANRTSSSLYYLCPWLFLGATFSCGGP
jgi:hypothetical protein